MPSIKTILKMSLITMGVIFAANQLAGLNPMARRILKGGVIAPVESSTPPGYQDNWMSV